MVGKLLAPNVSTVLLQLVCRAIDSGYSRNDVAADMEGGTVKEILSLVEGVERREQKKGGSYKYLWQR